MTILNNTMQKLLTKKNIITVCIIVSLLPFRNVFKMKTIIILLNQN